MIREATAIQKLHMDVQAASDRLATIESGDILVTATTATEPIIHGAEIKKGVYVAHLGDNDDQLTYTCNVGLGLYDVAIAARVYQYAKENGIGQKLKLWDEPIMV